MSASRLKEFLDAAKTDTRVVGPVTRHLMTRAKDERRRDVLHPSEICKADWCPRASFYRLTGHEEPPEDISFGLQNIFDEGHDIHSKWHRRLREMGVLKGRWLCRMCRTSFVATSPEHCACGAPGEFIEYREVPLETPLYLIAGHADGELDDGKEPALLEFKSIGIGTVRMEAPKLLARHTVLTEDGNTVIDLERLWRDIKRPFPTHLRQGNIYMYAAGIELMVFVYEFKPTQAVKEFVIRYRPAVIEDILDQAADVRWALKTGNPPERPDWVEDADGKVCRSCPFRTTCWGLPADTAQPEQGDDSEREGAEAPGEGRDPAPRRARVRRSPNPERSHVAHRQQADDAVRSSDSLAGLFGRALGDSGGG